MNLEHLGAQLRSCFCILFSPKQAGEHIKRTTKTGASRSASAALSGRARSRSARASAQAHMLSLARLWLICSCFSCVGCGLFFICIASRTLRKIIPREVQELSKSSRLTMRALSSKRPSVRSARATSQSTLAESYSVAATYAPRFFALVAAFPRVAMLAESFTEDVSSCFSCVACGPSLRLQCLKLLILARFPFHDSQVHLLALFA